MDSLCSEILLLLKKPENFTGGIQIRINRGMVDDPVDLPRPSKKRLADVFRKIIPHPFQQTAGEIAKKYRLEWFRITLNFNRGKLSESWYELPSGHGIFSVHRFDVNGSRRYLQERPNQARNTT